MSEPLTSNEQLSAAVAEARKVERYRTRHGWGKHDSAIMADEIDRLTARVAELERINASLCARGIEAQAERDRYRAALQRIVERDGVAREIAKQALAAYPTRSDSVGDADTSSVVQITVCQHGVDLTQRACRLCTPDETDSEHG